MACISPCPRIGLSTYIVCRLGASKPVSHMSRTITIWNGSFGSRKRLRQRLAPRLVADVRLPVERVRRRAGHHDLERALLVVLAVPRRPQRDELAVQLDADAAAHHHHHRLAVHRREPVLEVLHQVAGDELDAVLGADHRFELRPPALELLLALDLLAFGRLLELGVDLRPLRFLQLQLREPALVVDGHRGAVDDGALDVVDADVVAEHGARVGVGLLDRRAGEADERGVGQRVAHVPREAVDEVVLAAVRLVGDDDDVAPVREHRVPVALLLGEELLNGGEHHAAGGDRELRAQVGAVGGLHRRLAQQVAAAREGAEELVVEVVAVGEHDDRRVRHRRVQDHAPRIEGHRQALARALRVPDHANAPVAWVAAWPLPRLVPARRLCHRSPAPAAARSVSSTATFTAWNWW